MVAILDKLPDVHVGHFHLTSVVRDTLVEVSDDDVPGLAAEMAYHSILALFPFLLFLAGLTAVINRFVALGNLTDRIVDRASDILPEDATSLFRSFLDQIVKSRGEGALIIGLLASLWAASAAIGCVMKALNRAYDVQENRGFFARKAVALARRKPGNELVRARKRRRRRHARRLEAISGVEAREGKTGARVLHRHGDGRKPGSQADAPADPRRL